MNRIQYRALSGRAAAAGFAAAVLATVFSVGSVFALFHSATPPTHAELANGGVTVVASR